MARVKSKQITIGLLDIARRRIKLFSSKIYLFILPPYLPRHSATYTWDNKSHIVSRIHRQYLFMLSIWKMFSWYIAYQYHAHCLPCPPCRWRWGPVVPCEAGVRPPLARSRPCPSPHLLTPAAAASQTTQTPDPARGQEGPTGNVSHIYRQHSSVCSSSKVMT